MKIGKPKGENIKGKRAEAEAISFFFWHNLISVFIFFILTMSFGFYGARDRSISYIFSMDFLGFVLLIFCFSLIAGFLGRITAYLILKLYFSWRNRVMKKFGELNQGVNKISFTFILSAFITALCFALGVVVILQDKIFNEKSLLTLMATYILLKFGIYLSMKYVREMYL